MKRFIDKFNDLLYRKRLKKWLVINLKFAFRKLRNFLKSKKFRDFIKSVPFITGCLSLFAVILLCVGVSLFSRYAYAFFDTDAKIIKRLTMTEFDDSVGYLKSLYALGSSNRIQVTLKTDDENYIKPKGVGLDRGNVNLKLTFSDGNTAEFALNNSNYDNFESGMTDTFTIILPFGYTPFDITEYTVAVLPDINNNYDSWHCRWVRVYFMLGNETVMLARETWEETAVFGSGDNEIKQSTLEIVHSANNKYNRSKQIYTYYLELTQKGASELVNAQLKSDALDSLGLNGAGYLYVDIETVNIEIQNDILTYYTKGVHIPDLDSLDYDGRIYLDVTFFSADSDGNYTQSYLLDTLGTDDFELGTTSSFKLEMPKDMNVFDISSMTLRVENPYDSWSPHYIRVYIKPDYCDMLEIARLNDTMLINQYSTPVFYKNLIDTGVELDLSSKFSISEAIKDRIESENEFKFGEKISDMYFKLQSFYDRQNVYFEQVVNLYSPSVYEDEQDPESDIDDDIAVPDTDTEPPSDTETDSEPPSDTQTDSEPPSDTQTDSEPPSDTETDTEPPSDTETDTEPPSDTQTDSEPPTDTQTDSEPPSDGVWRPSQDTGDKDPTHQVWDTGASGEQ